MKTSNFCQKVKKEIVSSIIGSVVKDSYIKYLNSDSHEARALIFSAKWGIYKCNS